MEENKEKLGADVLEEIDEPLDKNVRLMSPTRMVVRRFFRSKLSVAGIIMLAALFIFCWFGPVVYQAWGEIETDRSGLTEYDDFDMVGEDGNEFIQIIVTEKGINNSVCASSKRVKRT